MATKKIKAGRPSFEVTEANKKIVKTMSGFGLPQAQIAASLGISIDTLFKYFEEELKAGNAEINLKVSKRLYDIALDVNNKGSLSACMFIAKTRLGWKETNKVESEITGKDGGPIEFNEQELAKKMLLADIESRIEKKPS